MTATTMAPHRSRAERTSSFDVADFPLPTGREEEWRFTVLDRLGDLLEDTATGAHLDWQQDLPEGVTLTALSSAEAVALGVPAPQDRAAALAAAHSGGAVLLDIPREAALDRPVTIRLTGDGRLVHGHMVIRVGAFAEATVVVEHDGRADYDELLSVLVAEHARLTLVSVQEWDAGARHLGQHDVVVGRDAEVRHVAVSLGGAVVRLNVNARYSGPGGSFDALGLYFADAGQHLEHRLFVDHAVPNCRSNVVYKGALQGDGAHTVWIGDVLIRAGAEGTDTYELNRNLVLTEGARADSVPNLEIETGQIVGAGHASATGRFDDEQLFYLQARGIPEDEARRMVVRAFFTELLQRISVPGLAERLQTAIEAELATPTDTDGGAR